MAVQLYRKRRLELRCGPPGYAVRGPLTDRGSVAQTPVCHVAYGYTVCHVEKRAFQIMNKTLLFVTTPRPASARTVDETCDQLDGGAKRWRRLAGGGVPQTVVAV